MSKDLLLSIIVPVYNVKEYLPQCVNSVITQTYPEFELILVDDGSTDGSSALCDVYKEKDRRILVIHKKNGGLSDARNIGLKSAKGKYILFLDSDDYLEQSAVDNLLNIAVDNNNDIVIGKIILFNNKSISKINSLYEKNPAIYTGNQILKKELKEDCFVVAACRNLYKRELLIKNNLFFKFGIFHEDIEWTPKVFMKAERCSYCDYTFYNYRVRENSITQQKNKIRNSQDIIATCKEQKILFRTIKDEELKKQLLNFIANNYLYAFKLSDKYYMKNKNLIDKNFPFKCATDKKLKIWATFFAIDIRLYYYILKFKCYITGNNK